MKELTDEQYYQIGVAIHENGQTLTRNDSNLPPREWLTALGRAAYAASFPHAVAEALENPFPMRNDEFKRFDATVKRGVHGMALREFLNARLARLTAKTDPAVEAVGALLANLGIGYKVDDISDATLRQIVAAVDAARKGAK